MSEPLVSPRLVLAFLCMLLVSGLANTFPVFFPVLLAEFGGSRAATASALTLLWAGGAVLGPVGGWLVGRWRPGLVVAVGLAVVALGLAAGALAPSLAAFSLAVGLASGVGVGLTGMVVQAALIADAYVRRRGAAMGIAFSGAMAGYVLAPPTQRCIVGLGWRGTLGLYAVATLALAPLAWRHLPVRLGGGSATSPRAGGAREIWDIVRAPAFRALAILFMTPPLLGALTTTQHAVYFPARGLSAEEASWMLGVGGVLAASGRVLFGLLADRVGAPRAGALSFLSTGTGLACLLAFETWPSRLLAWGYVLGVFLAMGSRSTIVSVLVGRIAPPSRFGLIFGLLGIGNSLGSAVGPVLSGALYDRTGSYLAIYLVAVVVLAVAAGALSLFCRMTVPGGPG